MSSRTNIIWLSLDKLMLIANGVVISLLLARCMSQETFGMYSYVQTIVGLFGFIVTLGMDNVVIRQIVEDFGKSGKIIKNVFTLRAISLAICFSIVNIYATFFESGVISSYITLQSITLFQYVFQTLWLKNQALVNNRPMAVISICSQSLMFIGKLTVIYLYDADLYLIFIVDVFVVLLASILSTIYYFTFVKFTWTNEIDLKYIKATLKESFPLFLSSGAIFLYAKIDQVMLKNFVGLEELAGYSIAVKVSQVWYFLPLVISSVYYPKFVRYKPLCIDKYKQLVSSLFSLLSLISLLAIISYLLLTDIALNVIFDGRYDHIYPMIIILVSSGYFVSMGYVNGKWMVCEGLTYLTLKRNLLGLAINLVLNFFMLPHFGGVGAAISTLLSIMVSSYLSLFIYKETRGLFYMQVSSLRNIINYRYILKGLR
jgi:O-antigen/teichoic acid export membrane protein